MTKTPGRDRRLALSVPRDNISDRARFIGRKVLLTPTPRGSRFLRNLIAAAFHTTAAPSIRDRGLSTFRTYTTRRRRLSSITRASCRSVAARDLSWARNSPRSQGRDDSIIAHSVTTRAPDRRAGGSRSLPSKDTGRGASPPWP